MVIEIGKYYANDSNDLDIKETNIILVKSEEGSMKDCYSTETMFLLNGEVESIYKINWLSEFLRREATQEEIDLFNNQKTGELKNWSELVSE